MTVFQAANWSQARLISTTSLLFRPSSGEISKHFREWQTNKQYDHSKQTIQTNKANKHNKQTN